MPKPLVNVFSKLAMPQDLGPTPYDQDDLQGWSNAFAFLSFYRLLSVWKFMPKPLVNVFSKLALPQDLGPNPYDQEDLQGWPNAFAFLSIVNYQFGNLCPNLWSTFSRNWRCLKTWDQLHMVRTISKGGLTHLLFFLSSNISLEFYAKFETQRFLETGDVSRPATNSM